MEGIHFGQNNETVESKWFHYEIWHFQHEMLKAVCETHGETVRLGKSADDLVFLSTHFGSF